MLGDVILARGHCGFKSPPEQTVLPSETEIQPKKVSEKYQVTKTYQEIGSNLSALEAFPKQWVREVGDRIRIPVKSDMVTWAFLWHNAGLNTKQIRKLIGKRHGNFIPSWQIKEMITLEKHRLGVHDEILDYWREKWRKYKGRSKWRKVKPVKDRDPS